MAELSAEDTAAFGRAVTARRAELGLTRKEVASRSGLSYPYVSNIESGHKQPSAKALHALATALELRPAELLERSDSLARLARSAKAARSNEDGSLTRPSWFRGELPIAASQEPPPRDDEMRSLVREVVREELRGPATAPPAIRAPLPDWLTESADSAVELAIQGVVLEQLHRLPKDAQPDEVQRTIDGALDHLIKQARRRRTKPTPKPK